jgi:hypothetical protein
MVMQAADMDYTNNLEFYAYVHEAYKRRIDGAETLYKELVQFFKKTKAEREVPTEKKLLSDAKAIIQGKKDGKIMIENVRPKLTKGKHIVIDEEFKDSAAYKETKEGKNDD